MAGWIKIHRKLIKHWIFKNSEYLKAWITILMEVNHEDSKVLIDNELFICKRGESLKSIATWTKLFGKSWSTQKTRTFLTLLEKDGNINKQGLRKTTKLTVCNYDTYQSKQHTDNTQINKQITNREQTDNDKQEVKELKKRKKKEKDRKILLSESDIDEIYNSYPRKVGKADGYKKLELVDSGLKDMIISKIKQYKNYTDPNYYKYFSTWVNQKGWEDEYIPLQGKPELDIKPLKIKEGTGCRK